VWVVRVLGLVALMIVFWWPPWGSRPLLVSMVAFGTSVLVLIGDEWGRGGRVRGLDLKAKRMKW
jgi:hypothetical protein